MVGEALERVRRRIAEAARRAGRDPAEVRLVCVTKGVSVPLIEEAIASGAAELGENRVQEAQEKQSEIGTWHQKLIRYQVPKAGLVPGTELRWHLIGHLQRNKVKLAVEMFDVVHSVDSLELVRALDRAAALRQACPEGTRRAQGERKPLEVLIQVNISGEATKHGCRPDEAQVLAEEILRSENLKWAGLMMMAPFSEDPEKARPFFRALRELRDGLRHSSLAAGGAKLGLSMGMSGDFEAAVEEGATLVRVGTAIFGSRA